MTNEAHYEAYVAACNAVEQAKARLSELRSQGEMAATRVKRETIGSTKEKIVAIRQVWEVYNKEIVHVEASIAEYSQQADKAWDAYEHSRGCN